MLSRQRDIGQGGETSAAVVVGEGTHKTVVSSVVCLAKRRCLVDDGLELRSVLRVGG